MISTSTTSIPGVVLIKPRVFSDHRGHFFESYSKKDYKRNGIDDDFVQDNISLSKLGTIRGLHLQQNPQSQSKLVSVICGEIYDVAVDVRSGSPHFGKWFGAKLNDKNKHCLYIPPGFAHGFCVLSEEAVVYYKCSKYYDPKSELSIAYNDETIGIDWPIDCKNISEKDDKAPKLNEIPKDKLMKFIY